MDPQPEFQTNEPMNGTSWVFSGDSDEEPNKLEPMLTSWNELSIIERVGLNSVEMSEADLENAFSQITLAFRCDQYTLKQRLQAEEHARNLAEENIQLELSRGRETLEVLKGLCLDTKRSKILQRLELSLDILAGTVERISNTAEVLGAVHQEARVSRAVELMVAHVENLRKSHHRHKAELQEAQKTIQRQNSCRNITRNSESPDLLDSNAMKENFKQNCSRRRVSISLLPNQIQEKVKQDPKKPLAIEGSTKTYSSGSSCRDNSCPTESRLTEPDEAVTRPPEPCPSTDLEKLSAKPVSSRRTHSKNAPTDTLRHRHRNKPALTKRKADKDKAGVGRHVSAAADYTDLSSVEISTGFYRTR